MPNACFRCKTPIDSGGTFCSDCAAVVGEEEGQASGAAAAVRAVADDGPTGRNWSLLAVAFTPVLWIVLTAATVGPFALSGALTGVALVVVAVSIYTPFLLPVFAYALLRDGEHVRARDDVAWSPSKWRYWGLVGALVLTLGLAMPVVAAYHLYRRSRATGLSTRHGASS